MSRFVLTPQAEQDLNDLWDYIAQDDVKTADGVLAKIEKAIGTLAQHPQMGFIREDWADSRQRFWPVYSYIIMYRPESKPLQVLRIISGYRNLAELLRS